MCAPSPNASSAEAQDCPPFAALPAYASLVAASTSTACRLLANGEYHITIHWDGGRHHALRNRASGFCYVADIVLGIQLLAKEGKPFPKTLNSVEDAGRITRPRRPRILYLDLDLHFGDGVHKAFLSPTRFPPDMPPGSKPPRPPQILTLSMHHASPLFFPLAAAAQLPPSNTHHPFSLSLPLAEYASLATYARVWDSCVEPVRAAFDPDYVVLQLGVDGLPGDRVGQVGAWAVEGRGGVRWCVQRVMAWGRPLCVLGGGGYDHANTARAWAVATSVLVRFEFAAKLRYAGRAGPTSSDPSSRSRTFRYVCAIIHARDGP